MKLILASQSPRRRELLSRITSDFTVEPSNGEEIIPEGSSPAKAVQCLAECKAREVSLRHPDALVIGSDTIVTIDGQILGKPHSKEHCISMLQQLSGRVHQVYTGVALSINGKTETFFDVTDVEFYSLSQEDIDWYVSLDEPWDKAGGYGIQGQGSLLVKGIRGDYFTVMGLPVAMLARKLKPYFSFNEK